MFLLLRARSDCVNIEKSDARNIVLMQLESETQHTTHNIHITHKSQHTPHDTQLSTYNILHTTHTKLDVRVFFVCFFVCVLPIAALLYEVPERKLD